VNQQAFPSTNVYWNADGTIQKIESSTGMSLRDYFAGQVLLGLYACDGVSTRSEHAAKNAYRAADAMLAEREKE